MFFPDNTVLINFGIINRYDLLEALTKQQGRWCASVANECDDWSGKYPAMNDAWNVFGNPIEPTHRESQDTQILRQMLAKPEDARYKHMGEAETITVITSRGWVQEAVFLTDDHEAAKRANRDGIRTVTTWDLFKLAHRCTTDFDDNQAWTAVQQLDAKGRVHWPCPPCKKGKQVFLAWLKRQ